ncbi:MAG: hypothetical protein V9E81_17120 [Marmoricola sp.]
MRAFLAPAYVDGEAPRNWSRARSRGADEDEDPDGEPHANPDPDRDAHRHTNRHPDLDEHSDILIVSQFSKGPRLTASWSMTKV